MHRSGSSFSEKEEDGQTALYDSRVIPRIPRDWKAHRHLILGRIYYYNWRTREAVWEEDFWNRLASGDFGGDCSTSSGQTECISEEDRKLRTSSRTIFEERESSPKMRRIPGTEPDSTSIPEPESSMDIDVCYEIQNFRRSGPPLAVRCGGQGSKNSGNTFPFNSASSSLDAVVNDLHNARICAVFDTSSLISCLEVLGYCEKHEVVLRLSYTVLRELDGLKVKSTKLRIQANAAHYRIEKMQRNYPHLVSFESAADMTAQLFVSSDFGSENVRFDARNADELIIKTALALKQRADLDPKTAAERIFLVSEDANMRVKGKANSISSISSSDFMKMLDTKTQIKAAVPMKVFFRDPPTQAASKSKRAPVPPPSVPVVSKSVISKSKKKKHEVSNFDHSAVKSAAIPMGRPTTSSNFSGCHAILPSMKLNVPNCHVSLSEPPNPNINKCASCSCAASTTKIIQQVHCPAPFGTTNVCNHGDGVNGTKEKSKGARRRANKRNKKAIEAGAGPGRLDGVCSAVGGSPQSSSANSNWVEVLPDPGPGTSTAVCADSQTATVKPVSVVSTSVARLRIDDSPVTQLGQSQNAANGYGGQLQLESVQNENYSPGEVEKFLFILKNSVDQAVTAMRTEGSCSKEAQLRVVATACFRFLQRGYDRTDFADFLQAVWCLYTSCGGNERNFSINREQLFHEVSTGGVEGIFIISCRDFISYLEKLGWKSDE